MFFGVKNRVRLKIADCDISVVSEDDEEYIRAIGSHVDERIQNLIDNSPVMSTTHAAIFAALDFCDELSKEKAISDHLRSQIKEYSDEAAKARQREEEALRQLKALKTMNGLKALQEKRKNDEK